MIEIINIADGEELSYPLCLLRIGNIPQNETEAFVRNTSEQNGNFKSYSITGQAFNAFVFLLEGQNEIEVQVGFMKARRKVFYRPPKHSRTVRLLYVTCLNDETFQGPPHMKKDANEAVKRIQVGALVLQSYIGESLWAEGLGRKTFKLDMTKKGMPKVFVIQIPYTIQEAHNFPEEKLWENIAIQILSSPLASRSCKYLAFFCGTRFLNPQKLIVNNEKDVLAMTKGHVSLGGGGLALVGTGPLYCWASDINEILDCMKSKKAIDSKNLMDFSATRGTWGACYGTHLGSVLHELGHTFDLGHTTHGIMSRGFEDFHLYFNYTYLHNDFLSQSLHQKNLLKPSMSSSLIKDSMTFTTDFVRKQSVDNISMVVEPLKDPLASSVVYSPLATPKALHQPFLSYHDNTLIDINDPTSPGFERFELSCFSQNIQKVEFAPKSPNAATTSELNNFFKSPVMEIKSNNSSNSSMVNGLCANNNEKMSLSNKGKTCCRAFWARSNAVLLFYHKWLNDNVDASCPELKGSVLCGNRGIRAVELRDLRMMAFHHWEYVGKNPPPIIHLPWAQVPHWPSDVNIEVVAIDDEGGLMKGCSIPRPL